MQPKLTKSDKTICLGFFLVGLLFGVGLGFSWGSQEGWDNCVAWFQSNWKN